MILSRTPLRISLIGGGTDLPVFYEQNEYGCVISAAINQYVYIGVNERFDGLIRLAYSKNEVVQKISEIENDRIQISLRNLNISNGIEIFYISDVPKNMGLGGSSTFTVGLLNALYCHKKNVVFPERLAREACHIEIEQLKNPIGKQDQYASAFGGINYIKFFSDGSVSIEPILINETLIKELFKNLLFVYLGQSHDASSILSDVTKNMRTDIGLMNELKSLTNRLYNSLMKNDIHVYKDILRESWLLKKQTSNMVSNSHIDDLYDKAIISGAEAGKILGAGGGGFLMLYVPFERQENFEKKFDKLKILKFDIDHSGSKIVFNDKGIMYL